MYLGYLIERMVRCYWVSKLNLRNVVMVVIGFMFLGWCVYLIVQSARFNTPVKVGGMAPNIQEETVTGQSFTLDALRGKPVLLNFFTTWCPPCIQETPDLIAFDKRYGEWVHVVMIDRGDDPVLVRRYVEQYHLPKTMTVLLSPNDKWSRPFGVTGQPETFFITAGGMVTSHLIGPLTASQMVADAKVVGFRGMSPK